MLQASASLDCATAKAAITAELISDVNQFRQQAWIAEGAADQKSYVLWQVREIIRFDYNDQGGLSWQEPYCTFGYNGQASAEQDLVLNPQEAKAKVFFQQKRNNLCLQETEFLAIGQQVQTRHRYHFVDGIGLVRLVKEQSEAQLVRINDMPLESYLARVCELKGRNVQANQGSSQKWGNPSTKPANPFENGGNVKTVQGVNPMDLGSLRNYTDVVFIPSNTDQAQTPPQNQEFKPRGLIKTPQGDQTVNFIIHEVRESEGLLSIAKQYNTTVETIMHLNDLKDQRLNHHQKLRIHPNWKIDPNMLNPRIIEANGIRKTVHIVQQGDMLGKIARRYNKRTEELEQLNGLSPNPLLKIGQELIISQEWINQ
jgi:LysM repeat protein